MENSLYCSVASLWEIAIKTALGRPNFIVDPHKLRQTLGRVGIAELTIESAHTETLPRLPPSTRFPSIAC